MNKNIGLTDRYVRILRGFVLIPMGIFYNSYGGIIGLIPLGTEHSLMVDGGYTTR